ncbi:hypothetical protein LOD99_9046 [Oopsacas minuta]|uniref:Uncharacterized protein n=1 Tax=Oopsacas minuta TaxID=111878 RepID=A0AAV7JDV3_9METZ|nr:hypothetical protein LOD99_9046 [Oopsacas minuta]
MILRDKKRKDNSNTQETYLCCPVVVDGRACGISSLEKWYYRHLLRTHIIKSVTKEEREVILFAKANRICFEDEIVETVAESGEQAIGNIISPEINNMSLPEPIPFETEENHVNRPLAS